MLPGIEIPVASLKTSPIALPFGGRSHSLSSLRGTQRFECVCCLAATAPAPSSRGPPLPVSARSRKSLQIVTPITGAVSGAGPRFECLQTKRCAYLWFARYPCSIFHPLGSRLSISASSQLSSDVLYGTLAVPPPRFDAPSPLAWRFSSGPSYPGQSHRLAVLSVDVSTLPFWTSSGPWVILWSDDNPSGLSRKLTLIERRILSSASRVTNDLFSKEECPITLGLPAIFHTAKRLSRHFLRVRLIMPHGTPVGCEPCSSLSDELDAFLWVGKLPCALFP